MTTHDLLATNATSWIIGVDGAGDRYITYLLTDSAGNLRVGHNPGSPYCLITDLDRNDWTLVDWDKLPAILGLA